VLSGLIDDLDIVAAVGIRDAELKQHANRIATFEGKLDHVAVSIQKFMMLLKDNALEGMEEIGQQLAELHQEGRRLRDQLAQARRGDDLCDGEGERRVRSGSGELCPSRSSTVRSCSVPRHHDAGARGRFS
jgi:hypothetical protein